MESHHTIVYKTATSNGLSPSEVIKVHAAHARNHNGQVLFTTGRGPKAAYRDEIQELILMTSDGSTALIAEVARCGRWDQQFKDLGPNQDEYSQPSPWNPEDKPYFFELQNIRETRIKKGQFSSSIDGETDLLEKITGRTTMVYATRTNQ